MDAWIRKHQSVNFDKDGKFASTGKLNAKLLDLMLSDPYFIKPPPKSTGRE
jgi:anhydro-N-acetylmuramic acid kinase